MLVDMGVTMVDNKTAILEIPIFVSKINIFNNRNIQYMNMLHG